MSVGLIPEEFLEKDIEIIRKKVFGSNEEYVVLQLTYETHGHIFRKEKLGVLCEVFTINCEEKLREYDYIERRFQSAKDLLEKNSLTVSRLEKLVFNLILPELPREAGFLFRKYYNFRILFIKLDENHLLTNYFYLKEHPYYRTLYGYTEFFEYRNQLYKISHVLHYDLMDDYFKTATENLTEIIKKDKLAVYLKLLKERHGEPIYAEYFDEETKIELLDYLYPDVGGERLYNFMKTNLQDEKRLFDNETLDLDVNDLIRFLYLSEKFYKQLKEEV
jgi:hypothetical protein